MTPSPLSIDSYGTDLRSESCPRMILHGDIDFTNAPEIKEQIDSLLDRGCRKLEIALSDVVFIDSTGFSALIDSAIRAKTLGGSIILVSPSQEFMHILEISGLKDRFEYRDLMPETPVPKIDRELINIPINWQMSHFRVPCNPELIHEVRERVREVADSLPFSKEQIEDIKLAVGEATTNAFRYGCPHGENDQIDVCCVGDTSGLQVDITDPGAGFDSSKVPEPLPGSLTPGGRGLYFMRLIMDDVEFKKLEPGMLVKMIKKISS